MRTLNGLNVGPESVVIYGAGLIGGYVAAMLGAEPARCQVALVCRPRLGQAIAANNGLAATRLFDANGAKSEHSVSKVRVDAVASLDDVRARTTAPAFLVVTMKRGSVAAAITEMRQVGLDEDTKKRDGDAWYWKDCTIVMMQNGVAPSQIALDTLGKSLNIIEAMFPFNVANVDNNPANFAQGSAGLVFISDTPEGRRFASLLTDSGIEAAVSEDMKSVQYGKLFINLNNAVSALSAVPLKRELFQHQYRKVLSLCMTEALAVYAAANITPHAFMKLPYSVVARFLGSPDFLYNNISGFFLPVSDTATSSMYEDLASNRTTEIDYLQGHISELGRKYGVTTPVSDKIVFLIKQAEAKKQGLVPHSGDEILSAKI
ncbi:ketopantoate reductase PanE/ApbA C terminal-domain-containing protein [Chytriomyces sp. MP71]|nr:ketopantoate reductase PanE/ApbA C terminal-domain-containing protein [Chytriomyces sp. MP71]